MDGALSTNLIDLWSFSFSDKGLYEPERDAVWKHRNREGPGVRTPSRAREKQSYGCERDDSPEAERYKSFKLYFIAGISYNHKMATFREAREALMFVYQDGSIDDTEFALLYDLNSLKISNFLIGSMVASILIL